MQIEQSNTTLCMNQLCSHGGTTERERGDEQLWVRFTPMTVWNYFQWNYNSLFQTLYTTTQHF